MRENRPYGSEGGEGQPFPTPIESRFSSSMSVRRAGAVASGSITSFPLPSGLCSAEAANIAPSGVSRTRRAFSLGELGSRVPVHKCGHRFADIGVDLGIGWKRLNVPNGASKHPAGAQLQKLLDC